MAFTCKLGASAWDAVAYVRALTEDLDPNTQVIPDAAYTAYVEVAAEDFSRHVPLDAPQVGDPYQATSPLQTTANVQRYVCSVANGFAVAPDRISDVLYRAASPYNAASEVSYLALLPFSPINRFLFTPSLLDSPSERFLRNMYLNELDHYGKGYYALVRDSATGLLAFDLYPQPVQSGLPIFVRYQVSHKNVPDGQKNAVYATVPDNLKLHFANFLYCVVLMQEADRLSRVTSAAGGINKISSKPEQIRAQAQVVREDTERALGGAAPVVMTSS